LSRHPVSIWLSATCSRRPGFQVRLRDPLGGDGQPLRTASERDQAATRVCAIRQRVELDWGNFLRSRVLALMRPEEIGALDRVKPTFWCES